MKVFRHQHPADNQKVHLVAQARQLFNKNTAQTIRQKERRASVRAGSDKLQLPGFVMAVIERHPEPNSTLARDVVQ